MSDWPLSLTGRLRQSGSRGTEPQTTKEALLFSRASERDLPSVMSDGTEYRHHLTQEEYEIRTKQKVD